ncbi:MAG: hypothetical protein AB8G23_02960 [Myxococcota bacterium]
MKRCNQVFLAGIVGMTLLVSLSAHAGSGVVEISQNCAVATGCFTGDLPGFPVTIDGSAGTSYALTTDLIVPDANTDGLLLAANDLSIDLAGFSIVQAGCVGGTSDCVPTSGNGSGVARTSSLQLGQAVRNGSVVGFGVAGVILGQQSRIDRVRAKYNRLFGIRAATGSVVTRSSAEGMSGAGFELGPGSVLAESGSVENGGDGVSIGTGSVVTDHVSTNNGGDGIQVGSSSVVFAALAKDNVRHGIVTGSGAVVGESAAVSNEMDGIRVDPGSVVALCTTIDNDDSGINAAFGSTVRQNSLSLNTGFGLALQSTANYHENLMTENGLGAVSGGVNMGSNVCDGSTTCP